MKDILTSEDILTFQKAYDGREANIAIQNAVVKNGPASCAVDHMRTRPLVENYSVDLDAGKVCNQKQSGRCWMFAAYNVFRLEVMRKLNLKNMELSQAYPLFFDKLEKCNFFLENILATLDEKTSSRLLSHLLKDPIGDGGQWNMFVGLTKKYGVCPKEMMPESFSSSRTRDMDGLITLKLRKDAAILRKEHIGGKDLAALRGLKESMLKEIYGILVTCLGKPPVSFTYETRDKDGRYVRIEDITPLEFYDRYVGLNLDDYVSLINAPTSDKPFHRSFTVKFLGNLVGEKVRYLNLPIEELKRCALSQLQDGEVVWFGSDVGKDLLRPEGLLSLGVYAYDSLFGCDFSMTKEERLDYGESLMTHAMVLTGVNVRDDGKADRWKVENSWGEESGYKGFYAMDDAWFDQFVYQVVVNKKYLTPEELAEYDSDPIELEPWDPMGSLAL